MSDETRSFDIFELCTALLLGFTALGSAVAGLQSGQWGGRQLDAFSEANTLTTKASTQYNEDTVTMNADHSAVSRAKEHLIEAREAKEPEDKARHLEIASYFYTTQLSLDAYEAMELPKQYYIPDPDEAKAAGRTVPTTATDEDIPEAALMASLSAELDHDYANEMLEGGKKMFADADKKFAEGRQANENGDRYELVGVFFTLSLFFAGLGLVFKTSVRWAFFVVGTVVFLVSCFFMSRFPWAG